MQDIGTLPEDEKSNNSDISNFLLKEYENIAKAFFNTYEIATKWLRYYFIILAVPFSFIAFYFRNSPEEILLFDLPLVIALSFLIAGALNFFVFYVIIDLRLDSVLYARTVNGIRRYFVEKGGDKEIATMPLCDLKKYILLPIDTRKPEFFKIRGDLFYLSCFISTLNSLYIVLGIANLKAIMCYAQVFQRIGLFLLSIIILIVIHFVIYRTAAIDKRKDYCEVNS